MKGSEVPIDIYTYDCLQDQVRLFFFFFFSHVSSLLSSPSPSPSPHLVFFCPLITYSPLPLIPFILLSLRFHSLFLLLFPPFFFPQSFLVISYQIFLFKVFKGILLLSLLSFYPCFPTYPPPFFPSFSSRVLSFFLPSLALPSFFPSPIICQHTILYLPILYYFPLLFCSFPPLCFNYLYIHFLFIIPYDINRNPLFVLPFLFLSFFRLLSYLIISYHLTF